MKNLCIFLFVFLFIKTNAQNLVRNNSFEEINHIPKDWTMSKKEFDKNITLWSSPTNGTPDIIEPVAAASYDRVIGMNLSKYRPHSGNICIGLRTYGSCYKEQSTYIACREYIQIPLKRATSAGEKFRFEIWLQPLESAIKTNNISIAFTRTRLGVRTRDVLSDSISIAFSIKEIVKSTGNWQKFTGVGIADSAYTHLVIGNFSTNAETNTLIDGKLDCGYVLIDDIVVEPIIEKGAIITLRNINFEINSAVLLESSFNALDVFVESLLSNPNISIEINGHTDNTGTEEKNNALSLQRANAVKAYFATKGVTLANMKTNGLGGSQPITTNLTEEGRLQNRRVEVKILAD